MNDERNNFAAVENQPPEGQGNQGSQKAWHIGRGNQRQGPFNVSEVTKLIQTGKVLPTDVAWKQGMATWVRIKTVPEFAGQFPPPPPSSEIPDLPPQMDDIRREAADKAKKAMQASKVATGGALSALKIFALNPISGVEQAYESLGSKLALSAGIVFLVAFEILTFLAIIISLGNIFKNQDLDLLIRVVIVLAIPFVATTTCLLGARKVLKGQGVLATDMFAAGVALLPLGLLAILSSVLRSLGPEFIFALFIFGECYAVFVIFACLTRLYKIPESKSVFIVPAIIVVAIWLSLFLVKVFVPELSQVF